MCAHRALDGLIAMLPDMRAAIEQSDAAMTGFHGVISLQEVLRGRPLAQNHWKRWGEDCPV